MKSTYYVASYSITKWQDMPAYYPCIVTKDSRSHKVIARRVIYGDILPRIKPARKYAKIIINQTYYR